MAFAQLIRLPSITHSILTLSTTCRSSSLSNCVRSICSIPLKSVVTSSASVFVSAQDGASIGAKQLHKQTLCTPFSYPKLDHLKARREQTSLQQVFPLARSSGPFWKAKCKPSRASEEGFLARPFSSSQAESPMQLAMYGLLGELATQAPAFPVSGDNVHILSTPAEYFEALLEGIRTAKRRIVLASLYLGTETLEQKLADAIGEAVSENPALKVTLLFDALRGTRPTGSTNGVSSTANLVCKSILSQSSSRVRASLYHTPELSGFLKSFLPARYNETLGIMHLKAYVFDNTILMSGANLSTSYFTDRQDRYILFCDTAALATYLQDLVTTVSDFSYPLSAEGTLGMPPCGIDPIKDPEGFKTSAGSLIRNFLRESADLNKEPPTPKVKQSMASTDALVLDGKAADTWVLPTVQMGPLGVRQDEQVTLSFFKRLQKGAKVHFSSAYFNLAQPYEEALLEALRNEVQVKIVTAAPSANGFFGSTGPSGLIPGAYSLMEQRLYERVGGDNQSGLEIFEYSREGWTFHAKGLWLSTESGGDEAPALTTIGSPNFGYRSVNKDLECQLWLLTTNKKLHKQLKDERDQLYEQSQKISQSTFASNERRPTYLVKLAAALSKGHL